MVNVFFLISVRICAILKEHGISELSNYAKIRLLFLFSTEIELLTLSSELVMTIYIYIYRYIDIRLKIKPNSVRIRF